MKIETRQVTPLQTRADVTSVDVEKRTFEIMWGVGEKVLRSSWWDGNFYEELSMQPEHVRMGRLTSGRAPFLLNHDSWNVADLPGVIESARIEGGKGYAKVRMVSEGIDPEADKVFKKIADRIIQNVSVGYRTWTVEKTESADGTIPTLRAVDWEPYEVSAVAMGADSQASIRSAPAQTHEVRIITNKENDMRKRRLMQQNDGNGSGGGTPAPTPAPAPAPVDLDAVRALAQREERERISGIRSAVRVAKLGEAFAEKLEKDGVSVDKARALVLEELAKRSDEVKTDNHVAVTGGEDASEKFARGAMSALLMTAVPTLVREAKAKGVVGFDQIDLDPGEMRAMSVSDIARESLERAGVSTRGMSKETMAKRAFTMAKRDGGPYAGTADFPILLENTLGKILLGAYAVTPDTWSRICKVESVDDFRASPRYRSGSLSVLDSLAENGEFKNKAIPDGAKLSISTATKGNIVAISRQLIINDDMSALADLMAKLGRASRLSIEVDFYALLAQNGGLGPTIGANPFFHSTNGNVNATASDITALGIDADRVVMASQKDAQNNEYLDLRPEVLLIPIGKGATARILNSSAINPDANGKIQQPNAVNGLFRDIVDTARLSGTRRYLFANPNVAPAFVVAFLKGQQNPVIESEEGWRVDGTEMKVRFDYLVQPFDVKGAVTNAGA